MKRRVALGVLSNGYAQASGILIQLLMVPVLAGHWGLTIYGQWLMLAAVPVFLASSDFGFGWAGGNRIISEIARDDAASAHVTFQSAWAIILAGSTLVITLLVALSWLVPSSLVVAHQGLGNLETRWVLTLLCLYSGIAVQSGIFGMIARAHGRYSSFTAGVATLAAVEGFAVMGGVLAGAGPLEAAGIMLVTRTLGVCLMVGLVRKWAPWLELGVKDSRRDRIDALLRPSLATMAYPLAQAAFLQGSAIVVGIAGTPAMVPIFTTLRTLSRIGLQGLNVLFVPLMTEYTIASATGNQARISRINGITVLLALSIGISFGLGLFTFGSWLIHLWSGGAIRPSQQMVTIFAIGLPFSLLWNVLANLLLATDRQESYTYVFVGLAFLSLAVGFIFVHLLGVVGIAWSCAALDVAMTAVVLRQMTINPGDLKEGLSAGLRIVRSVGKRLRSQG